MINSPISHFKKYIVPDDGACGCHSMGIYMIALVRMGVYSFPENYKTLLNRYLNDKITGIIAGKIKNQNNINEQNFENIVSDPLINKLFQSLKTSLDINQIILSLKSTDELYTLMYIMTAIWIHYQKILKKTFLQCRKSITNTSNGDVSKKF